MNVGSGWNTLLLRIGDKCPEYAGCNGLKEHIDTCYSTIWRELEHSKDDIFEILMQCAEKLPHKIPLYGVLVGLINLEDELFSKRVVDASLLHLQEALDSGSCDGIRIMMRFITTLMCSKVVRPSSIIEMFETLLSSASTILAETRSDMQPCGDFYVTSILSCFPWGATELIEQVPEEFDKLMADLQSYLTTRKPSCNVGFGVFELDENNGLEGKDFLEDLWDRIEVLSKNGWNADSVPRPHLSFEAQLVAGKSHDLFSIRCPYLDRTLLNSSEYSLEEKHEVSLRYRQRLYRLNIFPSNKVENMQPIDRFIVEEYLLDILLFFNGCRKECAASMVGLPLPFRYEYLMAETIFSQILLLPQSRFKMLYYTLVIIDLCKALPGAFPTVVAGAVRALFDKIDIMDFECRTRLILWFSQHLANFEYVWPWEEWAYVRELPKWAPQRVFVQEVLEREIRLSYWDKIKLSIENAPALEELLPPKEGAHFKYNIEGDRENVEGVKVSSELISMVKGRKNSQEIISWFMETVIPSHGSEITLEVVAQTLLEIGSKSFTHLITVLERFGQVISKLCPDHADQVRLLDEVSSYWKDNSQMIVITIERMMGYLLVSNVAIVSWVFSAANVEQFHTSDRPWEILRNTISKTFNRINDLRKEITSLKKEVSSAERSAMKAKEELDAAEAMLEVVDGQPVQVEKPGRLKRLKGYADKAKEVLQSIRESLVAKEALLDQAIKENKALYLSLYKSFARVLEQRLPPLTADGKVPKLRAGSSDAMCVDHEEPSNMDGAETKSSNDRATYVYNTGEQEQWCLTTLGYVKAFSRQYASEILPHLDVLDSEVFLGGAHPLFLAAMYAGIGRPLPQLHYV